MGRAGPLGPPCRSSAEPVENRRAQRSRPTFKYRRGGFTLAEVLAALMFMAILIPVAMQGISVASRAGILAQRKATATRVAERMLDELIVTGQLAQGAANGVVTEGDVSYPWTLSSTSWSVDAMTQAAVLVTFEVQGQPFEVSVTTLVDLNAPTATATTTASTVAGR